MGREHYLVLVICPSLRKITQKACSWKLEHWRPDKHCQTLLVLNSGSAVPLSPSIWLPCIIFASLLNQRNSSQQKKKRRKKKGLHPQRHLPGPNIRLNLTRLSHWQPVYLNHSDNLMEQHYVCSRESVQEIKDVLMCNWNQSWLTTRLRNGRLEACDEKKRALHWFRIGPIILSDSWWIVFYFRPSSLSKPH